MYLIDTNVLLEIMLSQERAEEAKQFLDRSPRENLHLSDFSLHSIGLTLLRRQMHDVFIKSVDDLLIGGGIRLVRLSATDMRSVADRAQRFNLNFDDAYQYVAAEKYGLAIVSFDSDFDRTERRRKTPSEILAVGE